MKLLKSYFWPMNLFKYFTKMFIHLIKTTLICLKRFKQFHFLCFLFCFLKIILNNFNKIHGLDCIDIQPFRSSRTVIKKLIFFFLTYMFVQVRKKFQCNFVKLSSNKVN